MLRPKTDLVKHEEVKTIAWPTTLVYSSGSSYYGHNVLQHSCTGIIVTHVERT